MAGWNTLVQAETLAIALGRPDLAIVDCRFSLANPGAGESALPARATCPGAVYAHLDRDLSDMRKQGDGRHPWPDAAAFTAKLGEWGITPQHQVVAYDDGDGAHAARLWFLLRMLGHEKVAVLDGGWARWTALGLAGRHAASRKPMTARYAGAVRRRRACSMRTQVQARLDAGELLIDARAADRFRGENETIDRVAGHVPGARQSSVRREPRRRPLQGADAAGRRIPRAARRARRRNSVMVMCGSRRHRVPPPAGDGTRGPARRALVHRLVERLDLRSGAADRDGRVTAVCRRSATSRGARPARLQPRLRIGRGPRIDEAIEPDAFGLQRRDDVGARDRARLQHRLPRQREQGFEPDARAHGDVVDRGEFVDQADRERACGIRPSRPPTSRRSARCGPTTRRSRCWMPSGATRPTCVSLSPMRNGPSAITR